MIPNIWKIKTVPNHQQDNVWGVSIHLLRAMVGIGEIMGDLDLGNQKLGFGYPLL